MGASATAVPVTRQEILKEVIKCVDDIIGNPKYKVDADSHLIDDMGCDSLDIVELSMELEERFDISIGDADTAGFTTPNVIADAIMRLRRD